MSTESTYAEKLALFYKQRGLLQASRLERVAVIKREIVEFEDDAKAERATHKAHCRACLEKQFCAKRFESRPFRDDVKERLILLALEEADEKYAEKARQTRPRHHCDGFTAYWQNLRFRRFSLSNFRCETEGCGAWAKDLHHVHYDTYGFEDLDDVRALCRSCHRRHHGRTIEAAQQESTRPST